MTTCILWLRSLIFMIGLILATVIHSTLSLFTLPLPYKQRYRFATLWSHFIVWWAKIICGIRYHVKGLENLPRHTSAIVLSNHQSAWETAAFQVFLPPQTWVLKKELLYLPFFGWGLWVLEPIAIDRKAKRSAIKQIITQGKKRLAQGRWIIIFPEGTRVALGQTKTFTKGGAMLAQASGHPVVPIAHNAGLFWPRNSFLKKPGTITVEIGPVIESRDRTMNEIHQLSKDWIIQTMQSLLPERMDSLPRRHTAA